jgi:hypothetical protein
MMRLLQLAQELDWQVLELRRAHPEEKAEQQLTLFAIADKIQCELLSTVRFDSWRLVGVGGPIMTTLDAVGDLLVAVDEIRRITITDVSGLRRAVRSLQGLLKGFCDEATPAAA